uniref:Uncharacterized protein n=1 Tax=Meloidogyne hapla TaxID=6305 RepID=A0A1I8BTZ4_MELHA
MTVLFRTLKQISGEMITNNPNMNLHEIIIEQGKDEISKLRRLNIPRIFDREPFKITSNKLEKFIEYYNKKFEEKFELKIIENGLNNISKIMNFEDYKNYLDNKCLLSYYGKEDFDTKEKLTADAINNIQLR